MIYTGVKFYQKIGIHANLVKLDENYKLWCCFTFQIAKVPCEFVLNFDPTYPVILGGLLSSEDTIGYVQVSLCVMDLAFVKAKIDQIFSMNLVKLLVMWDLQ